MMSSSMTKVKRHWHSVPLMLLWHGIDPSQQLTMTVAPFLWNHGLLTCSLACETVNGRTSFG